MFLTQPFRLAIELLGEFTQFLGHAFRCFPTLWHRRGLLLKHCEAIGVTSIGIISAAAIFLGAALGYQLYMSFKYFGAEGLLGGSVGVSLFRELAPVMGGIMVTGRAGAAIAAELSTMRITEQLDALEVMAVDPIEYLVTPRLVAGALMVPILSFFFAVVASYSAYLISSYVMGLDPAIFWKQYRWVVDPIDLVHCLVKGFFFGGAITSIACFCGFRARGGAHAVGDATRATVVAACLAILFSDYILTSLLPFGFSKLKVSELQ